MKLAEQPFVFVVRCAECGEVIDEIEVTGTWREAECWAIVAQAAHDKERHE